MRFPKDHFRVIKGFFRDYGQTVRMVLGTHLFIGSIDLDFVEVINLRKSIVTGEKLVFFHLRNY